MTYLMDLDKSSTFTKVNLRKGYYQARIAKED